MFFLGRLGSSFQPWFLGEKWYPSTGCMSQNLPALSFMALWTAVTASWATCFGLPLPTCQCANIMVTLGLHHNVQLDSEWLPEKRVLWWSPCQWHKMGKVILADLEGYMGDLITNAQECQCRVRIHKGPLLSNEEIILLLASWVGDTPNQTLNQQKTLT